MASLSFLLAMSGFTATYIKSVVFIFTLLFPNLSPWLFSSLFVGVAFLMALRESMLSVIYTDVVTFVVTLAFFPLMAFFVGRSESTLPPLHKVVQSGIATLPLWYLTSLILLTMFTI